VKRKIINGLKKVEEVFLDSMSGETAAIFFKIIFVVVASILLFIILGIAMFLHRL
jgi:hypothetical protein